MNYLLKLDTSLFFLINHLPHNFFLDHFFGALSFVGEMGAVWFFLSFLIFVKNLATKGEAFRAYFLIEAKKLAVIWLAGLISLGLVFFLKEVFRRVRPEFVLSNVILPFRSDYSFSFPSGHALISFTFASLLQKISPQNPASHVSRLTSFFVYVLAVLISFSRIYLGYHYPLDILTGAIIGVSVALAIQKLLLFRLQALEK